MEGVNHEKKIEWGGWNNGWSGVSKLGKKGREESVIGRRRGFSHREREGEGGIKGRGRNNLVEVIGGSSKGCYLKGRTRVKDGGVEGIYWCRKEKGIICKR